VCTFAINEDGADKSSSAPFSKFLDPPLFTVRDTPSESDIPPLCAPHLWPVVSAAETGRLPPAVTKESEALERNWSRSLDSATKHHYEE